MNIKENIYRLFEVLSQPKMVARGKVALAVVMLLHSIKQLRNTEDDA